MVLMLLRLGANPNEKDGRGRTMNQGRFGIVGDEPGHSFLNLISLKELSNRSPKVSWEDIRMPPI